MSSLMEMQMNQIKISAAEGEMIDTLLLLKQEEDHVNDETGPEALSFAEALSARAEEGDFKMSIGATYVPDVSDLFENDSEGSEEEEDTAFDAVNDQEYMAHEIDEVLASAVASFKQGITPEHLAKVWRISHEEAKKTSDVNSQHAVRPAIQVLSKNMGPMIGCCNTRE